VANAQQTLGEQRTKRRATDTFSVGSGPPHARRPVRDLDDPILFGVHPAATRPGTGQMDRIPEFVSRDRFGEVQGRVAAGGFVLLVGESTAGKSRMAYEAMRAAVPDHEVFRARPSDDLAVLTDVVERTRRCVVWLDELDQFLGVGGLTMEIVARMLGGRRRHTVLLATMRSKEYDRYSARQRDLTDAATWRAGRDVLLMATDPVELDRLWSHAEVARARSMTRDPRVAAACERADRFGVAELLAAGPELASDWAHASQPGQHPRGAAVVAAAVDCRRMGLHRPISEALLRRLHEPYLADRGGPLLRPEPFADALAWATSITHGTSSLLLPSSDGYLAFDYLIDLPWLRDIPQASWRSLLEAVTPVEAYDIGWSAIALQRTDQALRAFDIARVHNVPDAEYSYVIALGNSGRSADAANRLTSEVADRQRRLGAGGCQCGQAGA